MSELSDYSLNCDYLREKFDLDPSASLYSMINKAVDFIKDLDDKAELKLLKEQVKLTEEPSQKEKEQCQKKTPLKSVKSKKLKRKSSQPKG